MPEKRKVTVDGEEFEVEIRPGDGNWEVCIEGRTYAVEVEGIERRAPVSYTHLTLPTSDLV